ncbi:MAG: beta-N-acetylhexosaminidase [Kiritimatiellae bacterium]|nr:beta-N-acetylhexosaminidase [Kiritimatiellia bacterium]
MFAAIAAASAAFAAPMLIPAPREMSVTGGRVALAAVSKPKVEVVASISPEGYELSITTNGVSIRHSDDAGLFYAKVTLAQLRAGATDASLPCLEIKDAPAFRWRGVHLGETQRLFGKGTIKRMLDLMSRYKFNVFHWHFTDDRGWRIDFPEYPNLARKSDPPGLCSNEQALFYSKEDVREILAYAKARHITVVPELDFPGHSRAITAAYPDFACQLKAKSRPNVLCVGNPETLKFAERALDWVCELFPSEAIHIGGDECSRRPWQKCPRCKAFMERHGMKSAREIQPWLTRHLAAYLAKKGRKAIGWDDIVTEHGNVAKALDASVLPERDAVMVMGYRCRDMILASLAANMGYKVVQSPSRYTYFDYSQGLPDDPFRYFHPDRFTTTLETAYKFDPYEDVKPEARANVIGGQCCNWTKYTFTPRDLEWKMWPRALATAEILWTNPDPAKRDFAEFSARAAEHRRRLVRDHVNCAPLK